jgi:hypothetical protein
MLIWNHSRILRVVVSAGGGLLVDPWSSGGPAEEMFPIGSANAGLLGYAENMSFPNRAVFFP